MALGNNIKKRIEKEDKGSEGPKDPVSPVDSAPAEKKIAEPVKEVKQENKPEEKPENRLTKINQQAGKDKEDIGSKVMLVVFPVGDEEYALTIDRVKEVVKTPHIAPIPQVPDYIKGVTNVRGNVVAVIDLTKRMGLPGKTQEGAVDYTMVINSEEYKIAISINQVPDTLIVGEKEIDQSSNVMVYSSGNEEFIKGIVRKDHRMIIVIDILEMIANEDFASS